MWPMTEGLISPPSVCDVQHQSIQTIHKLLFTSSPQIVPLYNVRTLYIMYVHCIRTVLATSFVSFATNIHKILFPKNWRPSIPNSILPYHLRYFCVFYRIISDIFCVCYHIISHIFYVCYRITKLHIVSAENLFATFILHLLPSRSLFSNCSYKRLWPEVQSICFSWLITLLLDLKLSKAHGISTYYFLPY